MSRNAELSHVAAQIAELNLARGRDIDALDWSLNPEIDAERLMPGIAEAQNAVDALSRRAIELRLGLYLEATA